MNVSVYDDDVFSVWGYRPVIVKSYNADTLAEIDVKFVLEDYECGLDDPYGDKVPFTVGSNQAIEDIPPWAETCGSALQMADTSMCVWEWFCGQRQVPGAGFLPLLEAIGTAEFRCLCAQLAPAVDLEWKRLDGEGLGSEPFDWEFVPHFMQNQVWWPRDIADKKKP